MIVLRARRRPSPKLRPWVTAALALATAVVLAPHVHAAEPSSPTVPFSVAVNAPPADLTFENRHVITFRATVQGTVPAERARASRRRLAALPTDLGGNAVRVVPVAPGERGFLVLVRDEFVFGVSERDVEEGVTVEAFTKEVTRRLAAALEARREQRMLPLIVRSVGRALVATLILAALLWLVLRLSRYVTARLNRAAHERVGGLEHRWGDVEGVLRTVIGVVVRIAFWVLLVGAVDVWLTYVLGCFPYTRPWSVALGAQLVDLLAGIALAIVGYLPSLGMVVAICVIARFLAAVVKRFLERVEQGQLSFPGLHPETAGATRRIAVAVIWLVALAAAFPYLPGASSEAFKGLSLLVGLVLSLGSTGLVAQAMSGLVVVYSRSLSKGDLVRVGDAEGVVSEVGLLSTKVVDVLGEEVTIPNTVVVNGPVRNFTRQSRSGGPLLNTNVSIGFDAPWRQVRALLVAAARRTAGLRTDVAPIVLQRSLGDFYVTYDLYVRLVDPFQRPLVLDELHGHIQDAFNEAGVQIMSPHFVLQPRDPVIVPRERWGEDGPADAPAPAGAPPRPEREIG